MRGDATLFTRRDEVEAEWRIISPIEEAWAQLPAPDFPNYGAGSEGPTSWHKLLDRRADAPARAFGHHDNVGLQRSVDWVLRASYRPWPHNRLSSDLAEVAPSAARP